MALQVKGLFLITLVVTGCGVVSPGGTTSKTLFNKVNPNEFVYIEPFGAQYARLPLGEKKGKKAPSHDQVCVYRGERQDAEQQPTYTLALETPQPVGAADLAHHYDTLMQFAPHPITAIKNQPLKSCVVLGLAGAFASLCPPSPQFWGLVYIVGYSQSELLRVIVDKIRFRGVFTPTGDTAVLASQQPFRTFGTTPHRLKALFEAAQKSAELGKASPFDCAPQPMAVALEFL